MSRLLCFLGKKVRFVSGLKLRERSKTYVVLVSVLIQAAESVIIPPFTADTTNVHLCPWGKFVRSGL